MAFCDQLLPSRMFTYLLSLAGKNLVEKSELQHNVPFGAVTTLKNILYAVIAHLDAPFEQFFLTS